ncbi:Checkpoint serine/threonine-protein kinase bub1 [Ceratocystis fimbriata CBS 114723]|uniref:Checkpoint serine/threonine-protein kinase bub1 n=1 Tax=Ceratocystis fimbriata CBS 114723 TaxID=1035309 RepID=A0A2C5X5F7_9PEZI|nr:Checkpoint serine/threonine-protein kinase bub1 [Ceratocystis fimbriata CBS 114723]
MERILVDLEVIYPQPDVRGAELSFEEVWARNRGWLDRSWEEEEGEEREMTMVDVDESVSQYDESFILQQQRLQHEEEQRRQQEQEQQKKPVQRQKKLEMYHDETSISRDENSPIQGTSRLEHQNMAVCWDSPEGRPHKMQIHRDGVVPQKHKLSIHRDDEPVVPKKQKMAIHRDEFVDEENRLVSSLSSPVAQPPVQKIPIHRDEPVDENGMVIQQQQKPAKSKKKMMDYNETQIIKAKLDSPSRPKISKRKSIAADPTMTIHTKSATDDIYDIFNAPLPSKTDDKGGSDDDEEYDSDEYESDGESMGTTRNVDLEDSDDDDAKSDWSDYTVKKKASGLDDLTCKTNPDFTVRGVIDDEEEEEEDEDDDDDDESDEEEEEETEAEEQSEISEMRGPDEGNQSSQFSEQEPSLQSVENDLVAQTGQQTQQQQSHTITHTKFIPVPPEDYVPPTRPYRDPAEVANNRLPFMTPITERTEMSLDFQQTQGKTPSRSRGTMHSMPEEDEDEDEDEDEEKAYNPTTDLNEAMSSPLIDMGKSPISYNTKIAQPAFPKPTTKALAPKGPIIKDLQINPMDEGIRSQILDKTRPPLVTYVGFFDHRDQNYEKGNEIRRFARAMSKAKSSGDHLAGPVIRLPDSQGMYTVKKELGAGAFAPVYLVENSAPYSSQADEAIVLLGPKAPLSRHRNHLEALKMETPPSLWEFFMMRLTHNRLGPQDRAAASLSYAHELHLYRDEGFLVLPYHPHGTLLDVVNHFRAEPSGVMDEQLAMFFSIELLRTVEALHSKAIMHGDLKADNCLLRIDAASSASGPASALATFGSVGLPDPETTVLTSQYHIDGSGGWATRGVTLIDFGRGIDMRAFVADQVQFIADWKTTSQDCSEMREGRSWTWHIDYHGLAGIIHTLLFGKYIETVRMDQGPGTTGGISGTAVGGPLNIGIGSRKYRIRESLKRYWQTDIWAECFDLLLNPGHFVERDGEGGRMPVTRGLKRVRESMEEWLSANCERGAGLKTLVNKVEAFAKGRR